MYAYTTHTTAKFLAGSGKLKTKNRSPKFTEWKFYLFRFHVHAFLAGTGPPCGPTSGVRLVLSCFDTRRALDSKCACN